MIRAERVKTEMKVKLFFSSSEFDSHSTGEKGFFFFFLNLIMKKALIIFKNFPPWLKIKNSVKRRCKNVGM